MAWFQEADSQLVKLIQKGIGARVDGYFGEETLFKCFLQLADIKDSLPLAAEMYNSYAIFADPENVELFHSQNKYDVTNFKMAGSGGFQYKNNVVSAFVSNGIVINETTSKTWRDKRVPTLYYTYDGDIGIKKIFTTKELPMKTKWAISGVGLRIDNEENYHPDWEGFSGKFSDVLRKTNHVILGVTQDDQVVYVLKKNCTMKHLLWLAGDVYNLKHAISLDGGHIPAINSPKFSFNEYQNQNNMIVFI